MFALAERENKSGEILVYPPESARRPHEWLRPINNIAFMPEYYQRGMDPLLENAFRLLQPVFAGTGNVIAERPNPQTKLVITAAPFGEPIKRGEALLFASRVKRIKLWHSRHHPTIVTLVSLDHDELEGSLDTFDQLAAVENPEERKKFEFKGLPETAVEVLQKEARRRGTLGALERLIQAQAKSLRVIAIVGDKKTGQIEKAVHFDLAGSLLETPFFNPEFFGQDVAYKLMTVMSTSEINDHVPSRERTLSGAVWESLRSPEVMIEAGAEFGNPELEFFIEPFEISELTGIRHFGDAVHANYSEGCHGLREDEIRAVLVSKSGSGKYMDKRHWDKDKIAVIDGIRDDGQGAIYLPIAPGRLRRVKRLMRLKKDEGKPTTEAVEIYGIISLGYDALGHNHSGVAAFNPEYVEYVWLDPAYYFYPPTCGTGKLAEAAKRGFARSKALRSPHDPRRVVVMEQPGHGVVAAVIGRKGQKASFDPLFEVLGEKHLVLSRRSVAQGPIAWRKEGERWVKTEVNRGF